VGYYEDRAAGLVEAHRGAVPQALDQIRSWHPRFAGLDRSGVAAESFTLDDAKVVHARQHGHASWDELVARIGRLARGEEREPFLEAFQALERQDWEPFLALLRAHPDLARSRGTNGNTLLNLGCALLCRAPAKAAAASGDAHRVLAALLGAGARVNEANDRGWTPLHQAGYTNQPEIAELLLDAGASTDAEAHGEGGTPLAVALFWGNREAAESLAARRITPDNLRVVAGLGLVDLINRMFDRAGNLTREAGRGRRFYRPHSGFPLWHQSNSRDEILDEALVWAAKSDQVEAMRVLVRRGARVGADPYRGTPLCWAAATGRPAAARWLIEAGADVNQRATFGGPSHGEGITALHLAASSDDVEMVQLLLEAGADPTIQDSLHHGTPARWAEYHGARRVARQLIGTGTNE
jgi:ankyrin repeat protein